MKKKADPTLDRMLAATTDNPAFRRHVVRTIHGKHRLMPTARVRKAVKEYYKKLVDKRSQSE